MIYRLETQSEMKSNTCFASLVLLSYCTIFIKCMLGGFIWQ